MIISSAKWQSWVWCTDCCASRYHDNQEQAAVYKSHFHLINSSDVSDAFAGGMIGAFIPASCLTFHPVVPVAYSIRLAAARVSFRAAIPLIFGSLPCVTTNPYSSITSTLIYELTCNQFHWLKLWPAFVEINRCSVANGRNGLSVAVQLRVDPT